MGPVGATDTGDVRIAGRLTAGSKAFKINHPLAPENKYLSHSSVESPDVMNIYNGNIISDTDGNATIVLPDYFEALNRDFRYQLTVIGKRAQATVAREIENNRFTINIDQPEVKVSWQVTGIRQDASAKGFPSSVEEENLRLSAVCSCTRNITAIQRSGESLSHAIQTVYTSRGHRGHALCHAIAPRPSSNSFSP